MFNKLNYAEKAQLFNGLSVLENKYGKEKMETALQQMVAIMEHDVQFAPVVETASLGMEGEQEFEIGMTMTKEQAMQQMAFDEMEIGDDEKTTKRKRARPIYKNEAERKAKEMEFDNLNECLIELYYRREMTQREIAKLFECAQRTVSQWINEIPQKTLKRVLG